MKARAGVGRLAQKSDHRCAPVSPSVPELLARRHDDGGGDDDFFRLLLLLARDQRSSTEGNERDGFHVLFQVLGHAAFRAACAELSLQELPQRVKGI